MSWLYRRSEPDLDPDLEWETDGPDAYGTFYPDPGVKSGFFTKNDKGDEFIITVQKRT